MCSVAPGGEPPERVVRRRSWLGGVGDDDLSRVGDERQRLVVECEVADEWVPEALAAGAVFANVVGCPPDAEVVAAHGEFADEFGEVPVVRVATSFDAEAADAGVGDVVPVDVEVTSAKVEEDEPGEVHGTVGV